MAEPQSEEHKPGAADTPLELGPVLYLNAL